MIMVTGGAYQGKLDYALEKFNLSRKDIYMIRPLIYAPESEIEAAVKRLELPIVKSVCPADGNTMRQSVKERIKEEEKNIPDIKEKIFGALVRSGIDGWAVKEK